jgi:hypothetical protein
MSLAKENLTESLAEARQQLKERVPLLALPDGAFAVSTLIGVPDAPPQ